jgi:very-short-patch-repair endonuclease
MKKNNVNDVNWTEIQKRHDNGIAACNLGLSVKMLALGVKEGLFQKRSNPHRWSDGEKEMLSEKRKKWLKENPDKHPWRKKTKLVSAPCEQLKNYLKGVGVELEEEVIVSEESNYSVDILIPSKNLVIEVNGNQHYDNSGNLKPYYQERHNHISSLGWKILEIHYTMAFHHEFIRKIIEEEHEASKILPFKLKEKECSNKKVHGCHKLYSQARIEKWNLENKKYIELVKTSGIDFSKFGWVDKVSKVINQKPQKVNLWMRRMMPDFYEKFCFKKKK